MKTSEYIKILQGICDEHGDPEVAKLAEDLTGNCYALVFKADKPFMLKDVHNSNEYTYGDFIEEDDVVVVGVSR